MVSSTDSQPEVLMFRQALTGNATELVKKLKELHSELKSLDQEKVDTSSLGTAAKRLAEPTLLTHKDKGVRIYVASCIADMLRLYAPNAPYSKAQLKDIFELFVQQLALVSNSAGPYFNMHFYLLESLSSIKSIVLITDIKNPGPLMTELFRTFFDVIRPEMTRNVQLYMSEILQLVTDEAAKLPQAVVDIFLAQFIASRQTDNPSAYRMACELGNKCTDKLRQYVFQYFSEVISTLTDKASLTPTGEAETTPTLTAREMQDFKTLHQLVLQLNKATPGLLLNVIPQIGQELNLPNVELRVLATQVLGQMFAEKSSQVARQYEPVFALWLSRRADMSVQVRIEFVNALPGIIRNHPELAKSVCDALCDKIVDVDEKVRLVASRAVGTFDYETSLHQVHANVLRAVGLRCRDKKKSVAKESINTLANLYNIAYPEIENGTVAALAQFGWIPAAILDAVYSNDVETLGFVDDAVHMVLFPPQQSAASKAQRLMRMYGDLDTRGRMGLLSVIKRALALKNATLVYLNLCEQVENDSDENSSSAAKSKLESVIKIISDKTVDSGKVSMALYGFAKAFDSRVGKVVADALDSDLGLREARLAVKDALSRIGQSAPAFLELFTILFQRSNMATVNKDVLTEVVGCIGDNIVDGSGNSPSGGAMSVAGLLLTDITALKPELLQNHLSKFTPFLQSPETKGVAEALCILAQFSELCPTSLPSDSKTKETLKSFIFAGPALEARRAMIIIACIPNNQAMVREIANVITGRLQVDSDSLHTDLTVLSQLVLYAPQVFSGSVSEMVTDFVIKGLLLTNTKEQETMHAPGVDWVLPSELDRYTLSKIMGIKILVNRAIVYSNDPKAALEVVRPVLKLLWAILNQDGEIVSTGNSNPVLKTYLRLSAAKYVVKLTHGRPIYEKLVSAADFRRLALTMQDPVYGVRQGFAMRVMKYLRLFELHIRYLAILILGAHEPEAELRSTVKEFLVWLSNSAAQNGQAGSRVMLNELALTRVLHLLATHPDFIMVADEATGQPTPHSVDDLDLAARYIEFYLETLGNAQNISLVFFVACQLKTVRLINTGLEMTMGSTMMASMNHNMYVLSDLAQYLIQEHSRRHNWVLTSYPGQIKLPTELYVTLAEDRSQLSNDGKGEAVDGGTEARTDVSRRNYLSKEWIKKRQETGPNTSGGSGDAERRSRIRTTSSNSGGTSAAPGGMGAAKKRSSRVSDIGVKSKRRSRSVSPARSSASDGENGTPLSKKKKAVTPRRSMTNSNNNKKFKKGEETTAPTRKLASRAAKAKVSSYIVESGESDEDEFDVEDDKADRKQSAAANSDNDMEADDE